MIDIYQVFHDLPLREGNFAAISGARKAAAGLDTSSQLFSEALAQCQVTLLGSESYRVACQQWNQRIQCCGHGLFAAAHALLATGEHSRISLGEGISAQRTPDPQGNLQTWLNLPALATVDIELPLWARTLASQQGKQITPAGAAATTRADGYLLLHIDNAVNIAELEVDLAAITRHTQQAVLLWQYQDKVVRMRYFAPQYGNDEDMATGSALRVLAPHLQRAAGLSSFDVIQCSSSGGRMTAKNTDDSVSISGNIRLIESRDFRARWQVST
ncbi:PhzF family phenazine biosynthesis protein [Halioglobus maricola]|uniref:PhzF family phenazine biosynthesis protein n=1 Tax=Halioglobus maricola TaxID=2601894 RepID=A0A5P9NN05_9GAMM|nr:PhzF family phenazine biosynthesis protein [Halioglobus maricola]QFU76865.1 PhzF family phenazine biosynthesis protein [Halioglobus maricola]